MPTKLSLQILFSGEDILSPSLSKELISPKYLHKVADSKLLLVTDQSLAFETSALQDILRKTKLDGQVNIATMLDLQQHFAVIEEPSVAYFSRPEEFPSKYYGRRLKKEGKNLFLFPSPGQTMASGELKNTLWNLVLKPLTV